MSCCLVLYSLLLHKLLQRGLALISLGKCGPPLIKVAPTEMSISNLRHTFTLNKRITLNYAERSSHTKQIPSRCSRFTNWLSILNFSPVRAKQKQDWQYKNYDKLTDRIKIVIEKISCKKIVLEGCCITAE